MMFEERPESTAPDFRLLFESAPGLYLVLAPDFTIVAVSNAYLVATMTERAAILRRGLFDVFPDNPDDPAATGVSNLRSSLQRVLTHRTPDTMAVQKYDIRRPESEGGGFEERYWSPVNSPVLRPDGTVGYIIHRVEDVTEFVRLKQHRLEASMLADQLRSRAGAMEAEIYRRAQEIQDTNRQLRDLQGELEQRVLARTRDLQQANEELQREMHERRSTEEALRRSEEQLRQSQKLEAIGLLAGGVAHDFNNLLTVILSYCSALLEAPNLDELSRGDLMEIQLAGRRASDLTRQLLAFSRQQVLDPTILDLNGAIADLEKMLRRMLGEDVELALQLGPDLWSTKADKGQLEQIVMNLVVNARDAMPNGGRLTIAPANAELAETRACEHLGVEPGRYIALTISDTGVGMDRTTRAHAFEPFFTTKERGRGTGLGLSTVFGIVKQSGGSISLESEPGVGTTFKIYLPRVIGDTRDSRPAVAGPTAGSETILLVEDEVQVRQVIGRVLRQAGYSLLEADHPAEALKVAASHRGDIDLLVTDVVMPAMNGRQLADQVLGLRPKARVLFMSGYTNDVVLRHGALDSVGFLQKPVTPESLLRKIREVLEVPTRRMAA
jgi:signal transduction histidine kinase/ActR/RegA family two-component response regulator